MSRFFIIALSLVTCRSIAVDSNWGRRGELAKRHHSTGRNVSFEGSMIMAIGSGTGQVNAKVLLPALSGGLQDACQLSQENIYMAFDAANADCSQKNLCVGQLGFRITIPQEKAATALQCLAKLDPVKFASSVSATYGAGIKAESYLAVDCNSGSVSVTVSAPGSNLKFVGAGSDPITITKQIMDKASGLELSHQDLIDVACTSSMIASVALGSTLTEVLRSARTIIWSVGGSPSDQAQCAAKTQNYALENPKLMQEELVSADLIGAGPVSRPKPFNLAMVNLTDGLQSLNVSDEELVARSDDLVEEAKKGPVVKTFTKSEIAMRASIFSELDRNHDGLLDDSEWKKLHIYDSLEAFPKYSSQHAKMDEDEDSDFTKRVFNLMDVDGTGDLSEDEYSRGHFANSPGSSKMIEPVDGNLNDYKGWMKATFERSSQQDVPLQQQIHFETAAQKALSAAVTGSGAYLLNIRFQVQQAEIAKLSQMDVWAKNAGLNRYRAKVSEIFGSNTTQVDAADREGGSNPGPDSNIQGGAPTSGQLTTPTISQSDIPSPSSAPTGSDLQGGGKAPGSGMPNRAPTTSGPGTGSQLGGGGGVPGSSTPSVTSNGKKGITLDALIRSVLGSSSSSLIEVNAFNSPKHFNQQFAALFGPDGLATLFLVLDSNQDESISLDEFLGPPSARASAPSVDLFNALDRSHNNSLSWQDFAALPQAAKTYPADVQKLLKFVFSKMDRNGDGIVDSDEFMYWTARDYIYKRFAFDHFDVAHSGGFTLDEYVRGRPVLSAVDKSFQKLKPWDRDYVPPMLMVSTPLPVAEERSRWEKQFNFVRNIFHDLDVDGNGHVSIEEFRRGHIPSRPDKRTETFKAWSPSFNGAKLPRPTSRALVSKCCKSLAPKCMSCALSMSTEKYCSQFPLVPGCDDANMTLERFVFTISDKDNDYQLSLPEFEAAEGSDFAAYPVSDGTWFSGLHDDIAVVDAIDLHFSPELSYTEPVKVKTDLVKQINNCLGKGAKFSEFAFEMVHESGAMVIRITGTNTTMSFLRQLVAKEAPKSLWSISVEGLKPSNVVDLVDAYAFKKHMFELADLDGNGRITKDEFEKIHLLTPDAAGKSTCCAAQTAPCLACFHHMTVDQYCLEHENKVLGCKARPAIVNVFQRADGGASLADIKSLHAEGNLFCKEHPEVPACQDDTRLSSTFDAADTNKDGIVSLAEYKSQPNVIVPHTPPTGGCCLAKTPMCYACLDGRTADEYCGANPAADGCKSHADMVNHAFLAADGDGDGSISFNEFDAAKYHLPTHNAIQSGSLVELRSSPPTSAAVE